MLKAHLTELTKINEKIKNDLMSQNYDEYNELKFDKAFILNLNNLLETIIDEQKSSIKWYPTHFGYSYEDGNHKFYIFVNEVEYSYFIPSEKILTMPIESLLYEVCTFLIDKSLLNELKNEMLSNVKIAKHNAILSSTK